MNLVPQNKFLILALNEVFSEYPDIEEENSEFVRWLNDETGKIGMPDEAVVCEALESESDDRLRELIGNAMSLCEAVEKKIAMANGNLISALSDCVSQMEQAEKMFEDDQEWSEAIEEGNAALSESSRFKISPPMSGFFYGKVLKIENGLLIQKTGREAGDLAIHSVESLDNVPAVGEVVAINYMDSEGTVISNEKTAVRER